MNSYDFDIPFNTANVFNRTDTLIPEQVFELLQQGKNTGIGSPFSDSSNIIEVDKLFSRFENVARQNDISELLIARIKGHSNLSALDIQACKTNDPRVIELKRFLNNNPENLLLRVDKSPDLIYVRKSDYFEKIREFLGPNFEKTDNYSSAQLEKDLESYRSLISTTFEQSIPQTVLTDMHPPASISDLYGMYKCHKDGEPIRGIVTSYNSIVCNAETYIKTLLEPIAAECAYTVDNINFKTKF